MQRDQARVVGAPPGEDHRGDQRDSAGQRGRARGDRLVNTQGHLVPGHATRDQRDDLRLREDRAHAAQPLAAGGAASRSHGLVARVAERGDHHFQKLAGARGAPVVHHELLHLAGGVQGDGLSTIITARPSEEPRRVSGPYELANHTGWSLGEGQPSHGGCGVTAWQARARTRLALMRRGSPPRHRTTYARPGIRIPRAEQQAPGDR